MCVTCGKRSDHPWLYLSAMAVRIHPVMLFNQSKGERNGERDPERGLQHPIDGRETEEK